ncbi:MAG: TRAP transporter substrate-binding protein [Lachnospiraceae bacterium]|nr:TRAP transporter substrate-binding protein [Lachnospiraceae bacterium]
MKRRKIALLLAAILVISMTACGSSGSSESTENESSQEETTETTETTAAEDASEAEGTAEASNDSEWPTLPEDGPEIEIINAYSGDNTVPHGYSAELFASLLEEHSGGKIKVTNYDNNSLGDDATVTQSVLSGEVTMTIEATSVLCDFVSAMSAFDMPCALTDVDKAYEVLKDSDFRTLLDEAMEESGFKLIGMCPTSFRETSSNKEIRSFEDFSGIRIRTLDNEYHRAFWTALGASPTTIAYSELYMALEQGVVDAQENPFSTIIVGNFYEQQDYIIKTDHIMFVLCYLVNGDWWDSLEPEYQEMIQMAMEETLDSTMDFAKEVEEEAINTLEEAGLTIIELDEDTKSQMVEAAQDVYDMVRADLGDEIVDALLNAMEE